MFRWPEWCMMVKVSPSLIVPAAFRASIPLRARSSGVAPRTTGVGVTRTSLVTSTGTSLVTSTSTSFSTTTVSLTNFSTTSGVGVGPQAARRLPPSNAPPAIPPCRRKSRLVRRFPFNGLSGFAIFILLVSQGNDLFPLAEDLSPGPVRALAAILLCPDNPPRVLLSITSFHLTKRFVVQQPPPSM